MLESKLELEVEVRFLKLKNFKNKVIKYYKIIHQKFNVFENNGVKFDKGACSLTKFIILILKFYKIITIETFFLTSLVQL